MELELGKKKKMDGLDDIDANLNKMENKLEIET
jgi:hypothetical protein